MIMIILMRTMMILMMMMDEIYDGDFDEKGNDC